LNSSPLILMQSISKKYEDLWANRGVSIEVLEGEIHALVGENGAGKSTLMKILFGLVQPNEGSIHLNGKSVFFSHPREALRAGIGMVQQQLLIFPELTSMENIVVGAELRKWGLFKKKESRQKLEKLCRSFGFDLPLDANAGEISFAHRQEIELLRVLYRGAKILILDEPSSLLAPPEVDRLLEMLRTLRARGHTIIFISHRLREVFSIADRITVLRGGKLMGTWDRDQTSLERIGSLIVSGAEIAPTENGDNRNHRIATRILENHQPETPPILRMERVTAPPFGHEPGIADFCLQIRAGEIFGIAGVVGNGQRAFALVLAGVQAIEKGQIWLDSQEIADFSVAERSRLGIHWLPENSIEEGALVDLSLWENMLLGFQRSPSNQSSGWLHKTRIKQWAKEGLDEREVVYTSISQPLSSLSGGNQQKVILTRTLLGPLKMVILEQPCRGLDIHAQHKMHMRIRSLSRTGLTFLIFSYDLEELLTLSHRIGVMYRGQLMGVTDTHRANRELLGKWMLGITE